MAELKEFARDELSNIYTTKYKAFKAIFKPPKLRNITNLNSSNIQADFSSIKRKSQAKETRNSTKPSSQLDLYVSAELMAGQKKQKN
jgi:hypothetical protein